MQQPSPTRFRAAKALPVAQQPELDVLCEALLRRDALADALVEAFAQLPPKEGFRQLEHALAHGQVEKGPALDALRQLLSQASAIPPWLDAKRMQAGAATLLRAGPAAGIVLGMKSLVLGYASPGGNKPLMFSGKLQDKTPRRLAETSRFVQAVSQPGGMSRFGQGFAITVKVRIMHAQVRRLIDRSGRWQANEWGAPINQHDMLATVILFSAALVEGLRTLGYTVSPAEADDVNHLWRYVGHVMGVDEGLLPASHKQALAMADLIQHTQGPPDDDSRALVGALFGSRPQMASTPKQKKIAERRVRIMQVICRHLIGDSLADQLAVPRGGWGTLLQAVRPVLKLSSAANRLPLWRDFAAWTGDRYWTAAVAEAIDPSEVDYAPPAQIRQH